MVYIYPIHFYLKTLFFKPKNRLFSDAKLIFGSRVISIMMLIVYELARYRFHTYSVTFATAVCIACRMELSKFVTKRQARR